MSGHSVDYFAVSHTIENIRDQIIINDYHRFPYTTYLSTITSPTPHKVMPLKRKRETKNWRRKSNRELSILHHFEYDSLKNHLRLIVETRRPIWKTNLLMGQATAEYKNEWWYFMNSVSLELFSWASDKNEIDSCWTSLEKNDGD